MVLVVDGFRCTSYDYIVYTGRLPKRLDKLLNSDLASKGILLGSANAGSDVTSAVLIASVARNRERHTGLHKPFGFGFFIIPCVQCYSGQNAGSRE